MTRPTRLAPYILATLALLAWGLVPGDLASGMPLRIRESLRNDLPSRADHERLERGYYEQILDAGRQPGAVGGANGDGLAAHHGRLTRTVDDVREFVMIPNLVRDVPRRIPWSTNSHGMRDREYAVSKPLDTTRIALVGDSIGAGWGVNDGETFEAALELVLDSLSKQSGGPAVEVLNFAVAGHGPGQRWSHFSAVGWAFSPDLVLYEATPADVGWDARRLRELLARGVGWDAPVYRDVLPTDRLRPRLDLEAYKRVLEPLRWELLGGVYRAAVAECRAKGVPAVWMLIPRVGKPADAADRQRLISLARSSGFAAVFDLSDAYDGADPASLAVDTDDFHPNREGHRRIARRLLFALWNRPELRPLWSGTGTITKQREGADAQ